MHDRRLLMAALLAAGALAGACNGDTGGTDADGDVAADVPSDAVDTAEDAPAEDAPGVEDAPPVEDAPGVEDTPPSEDGAGDGVEEVPADAADGDGVGEPDELGTNNQDVTGVERVIFLGDSITASPYLTPPWSDRIRDDLQGVFGSGLEFRNYAVGGSRTEDLLGTDGQLARIETASTRKTLVMFTIGGNDALQVMGEDAATSLAHMETKMVNLRAILDWLYDPAHFPGGVYVVFGNIYDPTDGEGDFTHCGIGVYSSDWPEAAELADTVNGWYLDAANEHGADLLDMHELFLGHGWNNTDAGNPYYCRGCEPTCPCPRWFDFTCIHPNTEGHERLAEFFFRIVTR